MTSERASPPSAPSADKVDKPAASRAGGGLGGGLLVLAALTLIAGGAGYVGWQQHRQLQQQDAVLNELQARLAALDQALGARLEQRASAQALGRLAESTQQEQRSLREALDVLTQGMNAQRQAVDGLRQLIAQDERVWRLGEIERVLSAAQLRLGALDDPLGARMLLREIDRLAAPLGGEAQALRGATQQIISRLDAAPPLDRDVLALRMQSLAQAFPALPRLARGAARGAPPEAAEADDLWTRTRAWVDSWLRVERKEAGGSPTPQPAPAATEDDADGAARRLLDARRALLDRQPAQAYALCAEALPLAEARLDPAAPASRQALGALRDICAALEKFGASDPAADFAPAFAAAFAALRALGAAPIAQPLARPLAADSAQPAGAPAASPAPTQTKEP